MLLSRRLGCLMEVSAASVHSNYGWSIENVRCLLFGGLITAMDAVATHITREQTGR